MISVKANINSNVMVLLNSDKPYYRFVAEGCDDKFFIVEAESCGVEKFFTINIDWPIQVYEVSIYAQDSADETFEFAEYIRTTDLKVYNPEDLCESYIADEFNYPLLDQNNKYISA